MILHSSHAEGVPRPVGDWDEARLQPARRIDRKSRGRLPTATLIQAVGHKRKFRTTRQTASTGGELDREILLESNLWDVRWAG